MSSRIDVDEIRSKTTNGNLKLTPNGSGLVIPAPGPIFHITKDGDQTLSDSVATVITFQEYTDGSNGGRTINKGGLFANNKLTVTADTVGYYWIYCNLFFQGSNSLDDMHGYYRKNGSETQQVVYQNGGWANENRYGTYQNHQVIHLPNAGDYVELVIYADVGSGGTMTINQNSTSIQRTNISGWRIG